MIDEYSIVIVHRGDPLQRYPTILSCAFLRNGKDVAVALEFLSSTERSRYTRISQPERKLDYLIGRVAAKTAIAKRINQNDIAKISIENGKFGEPVVSNPPGGRTSVTISHSGKAAVAIAHNPAHSFGIDIQKIGSAGHFVFKAQRLPFRVNRCYLSALQLGHVVWCIREAISKAVQGRAGCLQRVTDISVMTFHPKSFCTGDFAFFPSFRFYAWLAGDYAIAIVCPKPVDLLGQVKVITGFTRTVLAGTPDVPDQLAETSQN
jgi:phosphopantetheinyl transferase